MPASPGCRRAAGECRVASRPLPCWSFTLQHAGARRRAKGGRMRFQDKVALITAAASGIGRATADIMAKEGAVIVAVDIDEERLDRAVAELNAAGGRAHGRICNALDGPRVDALIDSLVREFARIDILVNAVGGSTIIAKSSA